MAIIQGAIIETATPPEYIFNIGVFEEADWDFMEWLWPQIEPTRYIKKLAELEPSDGFSGLIWVGAVKDEFGKWYDPNWESLTVEEKAAKVAALK